MIKTQTVKPDGQISRPLSTEEERLQALNELRILDTAPEQSYDDIVRLAANICGAPISLVSLVSKDRQWFKAKVGLIAGETPIEQSFCRYTLTEAGVMTVEDATADARFSDNPLVVSEPKIRFYAGAKLVTASGHPIGTLCVIDRVSRTLTDSQYDALEALARQVMSLLELRRRNFELAELAEAHSHALTKIEDQLQVIKGEEEQRRWSDLLRRDSEMRLRSVIKSANDGIFLADNKFEIILWNDASQNMFDYTERQVNSKHFEMLVAERCRMELRKNISDLMPDQDGKGGNIVELFGLRKDGSEFPIELSISLWRNDDTVFYTGIVRDVTERRRVDELKDEFVSTVSHELRTPLTSIRGALDLINGGMTGPLSDDTKRLTSIALHSTERLVRLINDILDCEKIASGKAEFRMRPISLSEVAASAVAESISFGDQYGVDLLLEDEAQGLSITGDSDRIIQVLTNLLSNAVKASSSGSPVTLKLKTCDFAARVEVVDTGSGIPLEFQARIFDRFSQADSGDKRRKNGTGLGLNIARSIVEKHGGTMGFNSVPGEGTVFYFDLPLTSENETN